MVEKDKVVKTGGKTDKGLLYPFKKGRITFANVIHTIEPSN